jgi:flagellar FliJ protein
MGNFAGARLDTPGNSLDNRANWAGWAHPIDMKRNDSNSFGKSAPFLRFNLRLGVERMKSRDMLARLRRFQIDETRRRVAQIEAMIAEFSKMARDLEREIANEEQRAGITDLSHFAYPTYARAARVRRDNLQRSAEELVSQLDEARHFLDEVLATPSNGRILDGSSTTQMAG